MATGRADRAPSQQGEAGRLSTHTHDPAPSHYLSNLGPKT